VLVLGAANRDPRAFAGADRLDLAAHAPRHLSFGYGAHFCVGAALMRIVLQEAVSALVARAPDLALAGEPRWTSPRRGFERLAVRW
jgi:cytochrome P450